MRTAMRAGDIGFVEQRDFTSWWIRFAQRRKYGNVPAAKYNHAFMCADEQGVIIEANPSGVAVDHISKYAGVDVVFKRPPYAVGAAAIAVRAMRSYVGERYGFLTIACVALSMLTGSRLRFGIAGTEICSGACADALTRANIDCGPDPTYDTPADLYSIVRWV